MVDYRGATIEDLQLSPALVLPISTSVGTALQLAFERDFSILPLHSPTSRASLLGYLSVDALKPLAEQGKIDLDLPLSGLTNGEANEGESEGGPMKRFRRERKYQVITPSTPLEELDAFFSSPQGALAGFALVTDAARKFVLGLVTREDLSKFTSRRFPSANSPPSESPSASSPHGGSLSSSGTRDVPGARAGRTAVVA
ncbi:hypothetical protein JCM11251_002867 [Rhodosporidiobolus azoricus]